MKTLKITLISLLAIVFSFSLVPQDTTENKNQEIAETIISSIDSPDNYNLPVLTSWDQLQAGKNPSLRKRQRKQMKRIKKLQRKNGIGFYQLDLDGFKNVA